METRYPCPVCLGTRLKKTIVAPRKALVVDLCPICGGIWFDKGEVQEIRKIPGETAKRHFELSTEPHMMRCHYCHAPMDRNQAVCRFCNWHNEICCPVCNTEMDRVACKHLTLDVCRGCGGVWFDRDELAEIWDPAFWDDNPLTFLSGTDRKSRNNAWELLDGFVYLPDMSGTGPGVGEVAAEGVGEVALEAAAEAAGSAAEVAVEAVGGAAEGVAEVALEAVGEVAAEGIAEGVAEVALEAAGGLAEAAVEGVAEVAVEAVAGAAESVAEAILEFIIEAIGSALG